MEVTVCTVSNTSIKQKEKKDTQRERERERERENGRELYIRIGVNHSELRKGVKWSKELVSINQKAALTYRIG